MPGYLVVVHTEEPAEDHRPHEKTSWKGPFWTSAVYKTIKVENVLKAAREVLGVGSDKLEIVFFQHRSIGLCMAARRTDWRDF